MPSHGFVAIRANPSGGSDIDQTAINVMYVLAGRDTVIKLEIRMERYTTAQTSWLY